MCRRCLFAVVGIFTNFSQFDSIQFDLLSEIRLARTPTQPTKSHSTESQLSSALAQPRHRHRRQLRHHHHPHEASLGGSTPRSRGGRALKFDLDCE